MEHVALPHDGSACEYGESGFPCTCDYHGNWPQAGYVYNDTYTGEIVCPACNGRGLPETCAVCLTVYAPPSQSPPPPPRAYLVAYVDVETRETFYESVCTNNADAMACVDLLYAMLGGSRAIRCFIETLPVDTLNVVTGDK